MGQFEAYSFNLNLANYPRIGHHDESENKYCLNADFIEWLKTNTNGMVMKSEIIGQDFFFIVFRSKATATKFKVFWL